LNFSEKPKANIMVKTEIKDKEAIMVQAIKPAPDVGSAMDITWKRL
jgi:hypothetical protein